MRDRLHSLLRAADLSEEEITIYLWLLKLQQSTIPELRSKSGLPNITVYRTVMKLEDRGLIEHVRLNRKQCAFRPLTLGKLARRIASKKRRLQALENELKNLDRFLPLFDPDPDTPDIDLRSGRDAFREEYLKFPELLHQEYLHIGNMANMWKASGLHYEAPEERWFINKRLAKNVYARVLDVPTPEAKVVQTFDSREKRTLVLRKSLPITDDFLLIGEKQVSHFLCDPDNPRVIVMRSPEQVAVHRGFFEALWKAR
ncbi:MAG: helix-turn-helix domain-containing protein [Candidatus Peribacteraceae bacterium]|nr:helix-turn-helix domain-containing protein [Candidatus Peribacteraceae bacterium]